MGFAKIIDKKQGVFRIIPMNLVLGYPQLWIT